MPIPPQFVKHAKKKQDSAAQDAKESPAQHAQDLASGKDKPRPGDKGFQPNGKKDKGSNAKRSALLAQLRGK